MVRGGGAADVARTAFQGFDGALPRLGASARDAAARRLSGAADASRGVVVCGGGPGGLATALLLSRYGVPTTLVEPRLKLSEHPRAHVVGARTMEILRLAGADAAILASAPKLETWRHFRYCAAVDGEDFAVKDHAASAAWRNACEASEARVQHVSQPRVEEALRRALDEAKAAGAPLTTIYGRRVRGVGIDASRENDSRVSVELDGGDVLYAKWCVGADGPTGPVRAEMQRSAPAPSAADRDEARALAELGIVVESGGDVAPPLQTFVSIHFESRELARRVQARPAMLYFVFNDQSISVLVAHDVERGIWNLQRPLFSPWERAGDACAPAAVRSAIRAIVKTDVGDVEVHSARAWSMRARLDACMRRGPLFSLGDAAHEMPPSGGLGMNTAVHDAHNLAWKLAAAHAHHRADDKAARELLDSYDAERRPAAAANIATSLDNWRRGLLVPRALGLDAAHVEGLSAALRAAAPAFLPESLARAAFDAATAAARAAALASPAAGRRAAVSDLVWRHRELPLFFPKADLGHCYDGKSAAQAARDARDAARDADGAGSALYEPRFSAGERLPHFIDAATRQTAIDVVSACSAAAPRFALLVRAGRGDADAWRAAAHSCDVAVVAVDVAFDVAMPAACLVRPDGYIARCWDDEDPMLASSEDLERCLRELVPHGTAATGTAAEAAPPSSTLS
ncbi:FAD binding domain-containing protein [Pelagophyceae sp. CCMP2097]|nr:FAD binding domain-containing protein [Pelagophyceae sp. CCMP2097]